MIDQVLGVGIVCMFVGIDTSKAATSDGAATGFLNSKTAAFRGSLLDQSVPAEAISTYEFQQVPVVCGTGLFQTGGPSPQGHNPPPPSPLTELPTGFRSWECVPSVIRNNGSDTFRIEVNVNGPVTSVWFTNNAYYVTYVSGPTNQPLRDDGLNGDRKAGDYIFTSAPMCWNTNAPMADYLWYDTNSPSGLMMVNLFRLEVIETNGTISEFLIPPSVGVLRTNLPLVDSIPLSSNIVAASHLFNIQTTNRHTQITMRYSDQLNLLTQPIYAVFPDAFDFFYFFSIDHVEWTNMLQRENFIAGIHYAVKVNFTGTGQGLFDASFSYGSSGRLQGHQALDTANRGIYGYNAAHELTHQWCSYLDTSLGLSKGDAHYVFPCDVNSAVGGQHWFDGNDGTYLRDCNQLYASAHAPPLDKYMAGLLWSSNVPPLHYTGAAYCYDPITNATTVTLDQIQAVHGLRIPTPDSSQKNFNLAFVAETFGRLFNPVEMTFYETLAAKYTQQPEPGQLIDPEMAANWVSIRNYFGEGSTWSGEVLSLIRPVINSLENGPGGSSRILASGYPGRNYRLLKSTDFKSWSIVTNQIAASGGKLVFVDNAPTSSNARFYRLTTP